MQGSKVVDPVLESHGVLIIKVAEFFQLLNSNKTARHLYQLNKINLHVHLG